MTLPRERIPATPLPRTYRPPNSLPVRIGDGDDWASIAGKHGMDAGKLIQFNFNTRNAEEVNYYLRVNVGCDKPTFDGNNWRFTSSARPGLIYIPTAPNLRTHSGAVRLTVPHIAGAKSNSCWHDAARMAYQFKRRSDTHPLQDSTYDANQGLGANDFIRLAKELGFRPIGAPPSSIDAQFLAEALTKHGPLWAAGTWNGPNHVIVVTGVDSAGNVYVNDPAFPGPVVRTLAWFNQRLYRGDVLANSLMYLP